LRVGGSKSRELVTDEGSMDTIREGKYDYQDTMAYFIPLELPPASQ
jgi:hypothetical protein